MQQQRRHVHPETIVQLVQPHRRHVQRHVHLVSMNQLRARLLQIECVRLVEHALLTKSEQDVVDRVQGVVNVTVLRFGYNPHTQWGLVTRNLLVRVELHSVRGQMEHNFAFNFLG